MAKVKHNLKHSVKNNLKNLCKDSPPSKAKGKMESVWERLERRARKQGMSIQQVADAATAAGHKISAQALYQLGDDPRKSLRGKSAIAVSIALKCNERWLLNGQGPEERSDKDLSAEEKELIDDFRKVVDPEAKERLIGLLKLFARGGNKPHK